MSVELMSVPDEGSRVYRRRRSEDRVNEVWRRLRGLSGRYSVLTAGTLPAAAGAVDGVANRPQEPSRCLRPIR